MVAFSIILLLFVVLSVLLYQKVVQTNEIKTDLAGQRLVNSLAEAINNVYLAGDGFSQIISLPGEIAQKEYEVRFFAEEPTVFLSTEKQSWSAPLFTPEVNFTLGMECIVSYAKNLTIDSVTEVKVINQDERIYLIVDIECEGYCVDGFCCDTFCNGVCQSCDYPGYEGTCYTFLAGTDPEDECEESLCGSGFCKGGVPECDYTPAGQHGNCPPCQRCDETHQCVTAPNCQNCYGCTGTCYYCRSGQCKECSWSYHQTINNAQIRIPGVVIWCSPGQHGEYAYGDSSVPNVCSQPFYGGYMLGGGTVKKYRCTCVDV